MKDTLSVLNWNIGGAKYLELPRQRTPDNPMGRDEFRIKLNSELQHLIQRRHPDIVTLQEIVRYGSSPRHAEDIVDPPDGYAYYPFPLIDTARLSSRPKWDEVKRAGGWRGNLYFAQGNAFLIRNDLPHYPVWALPRLGIAPPRHEGHFIEQVNLESGLYFGGRNTEPRAALVAHLVLDTGTEGKPLDVFAVNIHLTTLRMEREGIPEIDERATEIRRGQLKIILHGIVSRYTSWRQERYSERGRPRPKRRNEATNRHHPIWVLAGDFNFTENSDEHHLLEQMNFVDLHPNKGWGTKAKGLGGKPTLSVDYIFAGPKFIALDPLIISDRIRANQPPDETVRVSDHYPLFAEIPLRTPD